MLKMSSSEKISKFPSDLKLEIQISSSINASEDPSKVLDVINLIIGEVGIEYRKYGNNLVIGKSNNYKVLNSIYEQVRNRSVISVLRRLLLSHLQENVTWFYVNKQAATKRIIVLVDNEEESPLGPIKISIKSENILNVIGWLCPE
ncbi:MAG TPA: RNA-binding domain-containing protein [Nitrososphaeraceae archaeon]|nr:RNA-binding domain-containing protein [Nitrososphaeraceae archaeon]